MRVYIAAEELKRGWQVQVRWILDILRRQRLTVHHAVVLIALLGRLLVAHASVAAYLQVGRRVDADACVV